MGVLIIFSIITFICITYVMLEPSERLKQQLYFFGKFPKGTKIDHSPTNRSVIVTYPSDETGTEVWEFDRISKKAKMTNIKDQEVVLWQNLELEEALNKFISDRRKTSLLFKLIKQALMYAWYFISGMTILISIFVIIALILKEGRNDIVPYLPTYVVEIILLILAASLAYVDLKIYKASKKHKKIRVRIA